MEEELTRDTWPKYTNYVSADWIEGTTYCRLRRLDMTIPLPTKPAYNEKLRMVVLTPSDVQINRKCDNCFRKHQSSNLNCSMSMGRNRSFLDNRTGFFDFNTQQPIRGTWIVGDIETMVHSKLAVVTFLFKS